MKKLIIFAVLALLVISLIFVFVRSEQTPQVVQKVSSSDEKCKVDSEAFAYRYKLENGGPSINWNQVQSHFNTKLHTCLVYIGNVSTISSQSSLRMEKVFDLSSGKVVLLSNTKKECKDLNSCAENPVESDVPGQLSYGSEYFVSKMAELMRD